MDYSYKYFIVTELHGNLHIVLVHISVDSLTANIWISYRQQTTFTF